MHIVSRHLPVFGHSKSRRCTCRAICQEQSHVKCKEQHAWSRRDVLSTAFFALQAIAQQRGATASSQINEGKKAAEGAAREAYASRDFADAVKTLNSLLEAEPGSARYHEMRAQALVDGKNFPDAVRDFNQALLQTPETEPVVRARLMAGRALALEGLSDWQGALDDYNNAIRMAAAAGEGPDPYIINSRGNAHASLGQWEKARKDYLESSAIFQRAKGYRGGSGSTTARLDGAVFSASNAAVVLVQLGREEQAVSEMQRIARRAPGSADMRAALAALYWSRGKPQDAETEWEYACDTISVGCSKYQDMDWLRRIRRWPPAMVEKMSNFLALRGQ